MVDYFRYNFFCFLSLFSNFVVFKITHHCPCLLRNESRNEENPIKKAQRNDKEDHDYKKNRSKEIKLSIKYKLDGIS